jgi:hypothetical protein
MAAAGAGGQGGARKRRGERPPAGTFGLRFPPPFGFTRSR